MRCPVLGPPGCYIYSCRYIFQHGYNLSLVELVDKIATPHVKNYLTKMTFKSLTAYPTPKDYTEILDMRALPPPFLRSHSFHHSPLVNAAVKAPAPQPAAEGLHPRTLSHPTQDAVLRLHNMPHRSLRRECLGRLGKAHPFAAQIYRS